MEDYLKLYYFILDVGGGNYHHTCNHSTASHVFYSMSNIGRLVSKLSTKTNVASYQQILGPLVSFEMNPAKDR